MPLHQSKCGKEGGRRKGGRGLIATRPTHRSSAGYTSRDRGLGRIEMSFCILGTQPTVTAEVAALRRSRPTERGNGAYATSTSIVATEPQQQQCPSVRRSHHVVAAADAADVRLSHARRIPRDPLLVNRCSRYRRLGDVSSSADAAPRWSGSSRPVSRAALSARFAERTPHLKENTRSPCHVSGMDCPVF